jgi:hypothetical protein
MVCRVLRKQQALDRTNGLIPRGPDEITWILLSAMDLNFAAGWLLVQSLDLTWSAKHVDNSMRQDKRLFLRFFVWNLHWWLDVGVVEQTKKNQKSFHK